MTLEEKLEHFRESCLSDAKNRADRMIEDHKAALEQSFEEHKKDELRRFKMQIKIESDKINREGNKELALEQIKLRRIYGLEQGKLKDDLFSSLTDRIEEYKKGEAYIQLLQRQIENAIAFAEDDALHIYLDPKDTSLLEKFASAYGPKFILSSYSFMGGTRAVIPEKNILIDNSFEKKLSEAMDAFQFEPGGKDNA